MIAYIEDDNSGLFTVEIVEFEDRFMLNTIDFQSPMVFIFKDKKELLENKPYLLAHRERIMNLKNGHLGLQYVNKTGARVFNHYWR
jgi:hypothetical protein